MEGIDFFVKIFDFCQDFGFCQDFVSRHKKRRPLEVREASSSHLKISNFLSLPWNLDNPYCHIVGILVPISKVHTYAHIFYAFL